MTSQYIDFYEDSKREKFIAEHPFPNDRTETKDESLSGSILKYMDAEHASKEELEEAFCRDTDAFNEAFQVGIVHNELC